jgi:hypothetical protein
MRKFLKLKKDPKLPLEQSKAVLSIVASLGDGAVGIPGLKTAAQIIIKIIEVAQVRAGMIEVQTRTHRKMRSLAQL